MRFLWDASLEADGRVCHFLFNEIKINFAARRRVYLSNEIAIHGAGEEEKNRCTFWL